MAKVEQSRPGPGTRHPRYGSAFEKRRRARNWATFAGLLGLVVLFYVITLLRVH